MELCYCLEYPASSANLYLSVYTSILIYVYLSWESPCGLVVNVQECDIIVNEFELQSRYYVHFRSNPIYPTPSLGQDMTQGQFLSGV